MIPRELFNENLQWALERLQKEKPVCDSCVSKEKPG